MARDSHFPDEELVRAIDGELAEPRAKELHRHLSHCWRCKVRREELESAIAGFVQMQRSEADHRIPPHQGPAARLRAQMAEVEANSPAGRGAPGWVRNWNPARAAFPALALVLAAIGLFWAYSRQSPESPLPNARLTPGAIRFVSREQACVASAPDAGPVPAEMAEQVFRRYGIRQPRPRAYEVDYLITPALGGAEDMSNLWPQPYTEGTWTAHVKDALEDYMRTLVCEGKLDLATAQRELADNWIAAYRKYFHTSRPLPAHMLFLKDKPWE
ncbi:MAG: hypothetical protein LC126_28970 [Bryobacterales bacterium]|nr:hypothetical protein [Bryobacterales bacterium]